MMGDRCRIRCDRVCRQQSLVMLHSRRTVRIEYKILIRERMKNWRMVFFLSGFLDFGGLGE